MIPATPALLIASAGVFVGFGAEPVVSDGRWQSRGALVDRILTETHGAYAGKALGWDAAFIQHVGYWAHYDPRDQRTGWTLPLTVNLDELGKWALRHGLLREGPSPGDLFLLRSRTEELYVRMGVLAFVEREVEVRDGFWEYECITIEGDSQVDMALGGGKVMRHHRRLSAAHGDAFIDWAALPVKNQ